jgi:hypothetical protein
MRDAAKLWHTLSTDALLEITVLLSLTSSSSEDEAEQLREDLVRALGGEVG